MPNIIDRLNEYTDSTCRQCEKKNCVNCGDRKTYDIETTLGCMEESEYSEKNPIHEM